MGSTLGTEKTQLGTRVWRKLYWERCHLNWPEFDPGYISSQLTAVSLQKLCFVDSSNKRLVRSFNTITYFDVKSDELKELPRPEFIGAYESYRLACLKGSVGLYGGSRLYNCELDVWIMGKDGWTRIMKINCYNPVFIDEFLRNIVLLGCTRNGEIIFQA
ncbi:hypothetical protein CQW23_22903 [Capsicum baccatum]|uniref:Uncharacterized protein n=1 Tax=Capsicum baccatum TaxID=33114 RepID=A0A2G2W273_CAPBA|nr:hypothetical protein CQW23_22903 [Capsicum baccatum]